MPGGLALPLRLTDGLQVEQTISDELPSLQPCETYRVAMPHSMGRGIAVNPPLRFDLRPPIDPCVRTVEPRQTIDPGNTNTIRDDDGCSGFAHAHAIPG